MLISYAQNFEDVMLNRALSNVSCGFYIDVGANDPSIDSVTKLFYEKGWSGINIEPLSHHCNDLQRERTRDINLCCAVGEAIGDAEIWECEVRGWATLDGAARDLHCRSGHSGTLSRVPLRTLTSICEQHAQAEIHFLKIDVEGYERQVLEGMDFQRFRPWIIVIEATRPNSSEEIHEQWEHLLNEANYRFSYADGLNRYYLSNEHAELSLAFRYPPNILDNFKLAAQFTAEKRSNDLLSSLRALEERAILAEFHVDQMSRSISWRITAPIRRLKSICFSRPVYKHLLRRIVRHAIARPALRKITAFVSSCSPELKLRLAYAIAENSLPTSGKESSLSPRVQDIYRQLKAARAANYNKTGEQPASSSLLKAIEDYLPTQSPEQRQSRRPLMAYLSPLPPARSGIADYSAELLAELAKHYEIDLIQEDVTQAHQYGKVKSCADFLRNSHCYERVIYHFGNSSYHQHMFKLLEQVPGIVVLHDFFLGDICYYLETQAKNPHNFSRAIYTSHGYAALKERFNAPQLTDVIQKYPANLRILQQARGIIVHSQHAKGLAQHWYGVSFAEDWAVIPLLKTPPLTFSREQARLSLGIAQDEFVVCSFGLMSENKLNHRLLKAWLDSLLSQNGMLVFVGEVNEGAYGAIIRSVIEKTKKRIRIVGWVDMATYQNYLTAADIAVQLRSNSRGETSAAVLDCMNHGIPTIINANGSFAELPEDAVCMLPDHFQDQELIFALEALWQDGERRIALKSRAQQTVTNQHAPAACAARYKETIEQCYASKGLDDVIKHISCHAPLSEEACLKLAASIHKEFPVKCAAKQLFIDVSATCHNDLKTGIQRVVRALVWELIHSPPPGFRIEPVYLALDGGHYRYAREWTLTALGIATKELDDEPIDYASGDVMLMADFSGDYVINAEKHGIFDMLKNKGVKVQFIVYDLLPMLMPEHFPPGQFGFSAWIDAVARIADGAICISSSVAEDFKTWLKSYHPDCATHIDWFHLGADLEHSIPTSGFQKHHKQMLARLSTKPSFLMVGTIEPRKGHLQTIAAFTLLWHKGVDINLVIAGNEGWRGLPESMRRTIPSIVNLLRKHPEFGKRLFWLEGISDEYLESVYSASTCLIAAANGEGFGLPLIEAAQRKLPVIARDIPVFRELACQHAYYFSGEQPSDLADAITNWLELKARNQHPLPDSMPRLTWSQSAAMLIDKMRLNPT
ncbi:MAG: FkbM family methyltransferase [Gallionella sp.]|jgi:FkbM family methyltransferase